MQITIEYAAIKSLRGGFTPTIYRNGNWICLNTRTWKTEKGALRQAMRYAAQMADNSRKFGNDVKVIPHITTITDDHRDVSYKAVFYEGKYRPVLNVNGGNDIPLYTDGSDNECDAIAEARFHAELVVKMLRKDGYSATVAGESTVDVTDTDLILSNRDF